MPSDNISFSIVWAYISPYLLPIIAVLAAIILLLSFLTVYTQTGETILDRLDSLRDVFVNFFNNVIGSVQNGIMNVINAVKEWVQGLIPFTSLSDIYDYVYDRLPIHSMSDIWNYVNDKIDDTYNFVGETWDSIESKVDDAINSYLISKVFEPVFSWVDYDWNYSKWIPWNLYYGFKQSINYFVSQIPAVDWLQDNYDKLRELV